MRILARGYVARSARARVFVHACPRMSYAPTMRRNGEWRMANGGRGRRRILAVSRTLVILIIGRRGILGRRVLRLSLCHAINSPLTFPRLFFAFTPLLKRTSVFLSRAFPSPKIFFLALFNILLISFFLLLCYDSCVFARCRCGYLERTLFSRLLREGGFIWRLFLPI